MLTGEPFSHKDYQGQLNGVFDVIYHHSSKMQVVKIIVNILIYLQINTMFIINHFLS